MGRALFRMAGHKQWGLLVNPLQADQENRVHTSYRG